jgi:hypothetical protein
VGGSDVTRCVLTGFRFRAPEILKIWKSENLEI